MEGPRIDERERLNIVVSVIQPLLSGEALSLSLSLEVPDHVVSHALLPP